MHHPEWAAAIDTELKKFEKNSCLHIVKHVDQHSVPMMWLFSIKSDGTKKTRLVGRGDQMIPLLTSIQTQYIAAMYPLVQSRWP